MSASANSHKLYLIVNILRIVNELTDNAPELFKTEGVFRIAASASDVDNLLEQITESVNAKTLTADFSDIPLKKDSEIHVLLGLIPRALKSVILLDLSDTGFDSLARQLKYHIQKDPVNEEEGLQAVKSIDELITNLLSHDNINHQRVGEILYRYCHVMSLALEFSEANKMNAENLARILAPHFIDELNLSPEGGLDEQLAFNRRMVYMLAAYLEQGFAEKTFHERYSKELEHMVSTRDEAVEKLTSMRDRISLPISNLIDKTMKQARALDRQIHTLKTKDHKASKMSSGDLKKLIKGLEKEYESQLTSIKELNEELRKLTPTLSDMGQEISELRKSGVLIKGITEHRDSLFSSSGTLAASSSTGSSHDVVSDKGTPKM
jgi:RhoGAP domain